MDVRPLRQLFPDALNRQSPVADLPSRGHAEDDEVTASDGLKVVGQALAHQRFAQQSAGLVDKRRIWVSQNCTAPRQSMSAAAALRPQSALASS